MERYVQSHLGLSLPPRCLVRYIVCGADPAFLSDLKPYVTELDLRHSLIADDLIADLTHSMPPHRGPDLQQDRDLPKYDYISFMARMTQNGRFLNGNGQGDEEGGVNGL